jgi:hypothetical protein
MNSKIKKTTTTPEHNTPKATPRLVKATDLARRAAAETVREAHAAITAKNPVPLALARPPRGASEARAAFSALFGDLQRFEKRAS